MPVDQRDRGTRPGPLDEIPRPAPSGGDLHPADAAIVRADPALPALALLLDPQRLDDVVTAALRAGGVPARSVTLDYLRYKPGTSVMAALRVATADGVQPAMLRAWSPSRGAPTLRPQQRWAPVGDRDARYVVAPAVADRRIPVHRVEAGWRPPGALAGPDGTVEPVRYRPGRRWVGRLDDPDGTPRALLKAVRPGTLAPVLSTLRRAAEHDVPTTPLLAGRQHTGLLATGWVAGRECSWTVSAHAADAGSVGAALARLHRVPLTTEEPDRCGDRTAGPLRRVEQSLAAVRELLPDLVVELAATAAELAAAAAALPRTPVRTALVHGDLNAEQVVLTPRGAVLLDLDRSRIADPVLDLASWLAHDGGDLDRLRPLVVGHQCAGGPELGLDALPFLTAVATLQRAVEPFRYRRPDWPDRVRERLQAARAWAGQGR